MLQFMHIYIFFLRSLFFRHQNTIFFEPKIEFNIIAKHLSYKSKEKEIVLKNRIQHTLELENFQTDLGLHKI